MSARRDAILLEMGLGPIWRSREGVRDAAPQPAHEDAQELQSSSGQARVQAARTEIDAQPIAADSRAAAIARMDWDALSASVNSCRACRLCEARTQAVLGVGDRQADWLFVGEGPGAEEDKQGEPFVGQAGKLLDAMLASIGLKRGHDVYIANSVKCRPPDNRTPEPEETAACWPYLQRQIELLQPKLIVALGRPAAQTLLGREIKIGASRGQRFEHNGIPLIVTYHPAYLLRNLPDKAKAWEDLVFARTTMQGLKSRA